VPKDIISAISSSSTRQDISNLIQSIRNVELNSNTLIDALIEALDAQDWVHEYKLEERPGRLKRLFFASKDCSAYAKKYPDILVRVWMQRIKRIDLIRRCLIS
jgi:hypothetical protein